MKLARPEAINYSLLAFLKLTASSRPLAPPSNSPKCLRFGHWLTLCTLKYSFTYLLTDYMPPTENSRCSAMLHSTSDSSIQTGTETHMDRETGRQTDRYASIHREA